MKVKKLFALLLTLVMLLSLMPTTVLAADTDGTTLQVRLAFGGGGEYEPGTNLFSEINATYGLGGDWYYFYLVDAQGNETPVPADQLVSGNSSIFTVAPLESVSGETNIASIESHYTGTTTVSYGQYSIPVTVKMHRSGFFTQPIAAPEYYIGSVDGYGISEGSVVYFMLTEGRTFVQLELLDELASFASYEISPNNTYATITFNSLPEEWAEFYRLRFSYNADLEDESGGGGQETIRLIDAAGTPVVNAPQLALYFGEWANGTMHPAEYYTTDGWGGAPGYSNDLFPRLLINGEIVELDPADLYVADPSVAVVSPSEDAPGALHIEVLRFAETTINYDHSDGKTYSIGVWGELPTIGLYSAPQATEANYITEFTASEGNDTIYLIALHGYTIKDLYLENFPAGTGYTYSADNTMVTIKIGHTAVQNQWAFAGFTAVDITGQEWPNWGAELALTANFPGIYFRYPNWESGFVEDLSISPRSGWSGAPGYSEGAFFYYFDGTTETRLAPEQLSSTNSSIITVAKDPENPDAVRFDMVDFGDAAISYTHSDGKTYSVSISCCLPEFGLFSKPVYAEENFIKDPDGFTVTEDNRTFYLVIGDTFPAGKITNIDLFNADVVGFPEGTTYEIAADGRSAAITVGEDLGMNELWATLFFDFYFSEWDQTDNIGLTIRLLDSIPTNQCGEDLFWSVKDGVLTFTAQGSGSLMDNYEKGGAPWYDQRAEIHTIKMTKGATIGENAFYDLYNVTTVELPKGLMYFQNAFEGCTSLVDFSFPDGNDNGFYVDNTMIMRSEVNAVTGETELTVYAKAPNAGGRVALPEGVTTIHFDAFEGCSTMDSILLPNSLRLILPGAFDHCAALEVIHYPGTAAEYACIEVLSDEDNGGNGALESASVHYLTYHEEVAPTCTEAGTYAHYSCDTCDIAYLPGLYWEQQSWQLSFGGWHTWDTGTANADGSKSFTCTVCGRTKTETVYSGNQPALYLYSSDEYHATGIERNKFTSWHTNPCNYEFCVVFFDGTEEQLLHYGQLVSDNDQIAAARLSMYDEDMLSIVFGEDGTTNLRYTHTDGKTYTLPVTVGAFESKPDCSGGHTWNAGVVETDATCDEAGSKLFTCTVCGETKTEVIPATGKHSYADGKCTICGKADPDYVKPTPTPTPTPADNPFVDVSESDWFFNPVQWAVQNEITGGLTANSFGPNAFCTRAQVVTFLYAAAGKPEINPTSNPFTDVSENDWFYAPIMWAVENGITGGLTPNTFGPNETCTRAQVVTFLYAAAGKPEMTASDNPFIDVAGSDWFYAPIMWAVEKGVTGGLTPNTFGPNNTCTRAQVVTFLFANETK